MLNEPAPTPAETVEGQLTMTREQFLKVRDDPRFHRILTLSRIVNSIRFSQIAILTAGSVDTPSGMRQRVASMFYTASILREAIFFVERHVSVDFSASAAYKTYFVPLLADRAIDELRHGLLDRLRNKAIFHNVPQTFADGLRRMNGDLYVFASTKGSTNGDLYYELTELAVMHSALEITPADDFTAQSRSALGAIARLAGHFSQAADKLIAEYLRTTRCVTAQKTPEP